MYRDASVRVSKIGVMGDSRRVPRKKKCFKARSFFNPENVFVYD